MRLAVLMFIALIVGFALMLAAVETGAMLAP